ncbi:hypothetical protein PHAVU_007G106700 [Phaseolus vulgaris]|uniref:Transposase n=1 Tax=Phaseolus vulgaris TaxID=3885 RepID=V7BE37_PHAVU|nr:hypothetical protein PHAVU_007G106700g [Phaseolus vulgaris]ESW15840.1 hypothetical protein PHAVU_007G106700g [Phaseolus vulgaris]
MSNKNHGKEVTFCEHSTKQRSRRPSQITCASRPIAFSSIDSSFRTSQFAAQPLAVGAFSSNSKPNVNQSFKTPQFAAQPLAPGASNSNSKPNVDQSFGTSQFVANSTSNEINSTPDETNSTSNKTFVASESYGNYVKSVLNLDGQGFLPSHPTANGIGNIFKSHYTDPWPSWKKIPIRTRDLWFGEFLARQRKIKPNWIGDSTWDILCQQWAYEEFQKKSTIGKINKVSGCGGFGGSRHTCGSISTSQHKYNMTKMNGIPPTILELFCRTHQRCKDNSWVDKIRTKFTRKFEDLTQSASAQGIPPPNELDVWCDVAGTKNGRIYGLGMESTVIGGRPYYLGSSSSLNGWIQSQELDELKRDMEVVKKERDELRIKILNIEQLFKKNNAMIRQWMDSINRQSMPPSFEETQDEDETQSPSQPLSPYQVLSQLCQSFLPHCQELKP